MLQKIRKGDGWEAQCDACGESVELPEAKTFVDAVTAMKAEDWLPVMINGAWEHRCPACLEAGEPKQ